MPHPLLILKEATARGRGIWLWGAGNQGRGLAKVLEDTGVPVTGFVDSSKDLIGTYVGEWPVVGPEMVEEPGASTRIFIIIAAFFFAETLHQRLLELGFTEGTSFLPYRALKPRDYVVEVSGVCNLRCLSCPQADRGSGRRRSGTLMSLASFQAVIDKLHQEEPFVGNIQLYQWGEPTLNPALPEMLRYARDQGILCAISSNLNAPADYEAILEARPEWFRISTSGTGQNYERTHTGGNWERFLTNLGRVAAARRRFHPQMKVELYYHRYRHSSVTEQAEIAARCHDAGFEFHPIPAYLVGLDDVLAYCEGRSLPPAAARARDLLLRDLDEGLSRSCAEKHLQCDVFNVIHINADLSVSICMMFFYPEDNTAVPNYLDTPLQQILVARMGAQLCERCMTHGIHRYCGVYARLSDDERPR